MFGFAHNVRALIIRIGFWGFLTMIIVLVYPPNPILVIKDPSLGSIVALFGVTL